MLHQVIAIDGPAASGKSTVARLVANKVSFIYMDTGAMYRAFAWLALDRGIDPTDRPAIRTLIRSIKADLTVDDGKVLLILDGQDPTPHIRSMAVNQSVSPISAIPELREFLVIKQRMVRPDHPLVVEGRDIGTVVFPDTLFKFFLDADPEIRQQRRQTEGQHDSLKDRDRQDQSRPVAPLIRAADAILIDSGSDSAEGIARRIVETSRSKGLQDGTGLFSPVAMS
jgi:cytidylate kinase